MLQHIDPMASLSQLRLRAKNLAVFSSSFQTAVEQVAIDALRRHAFIVRELPRQSVTASLASFFDGQSSDVASKVSVWRTDDSCILVDAQHAGPEQAKVATFCEIRKVPLLSYNWLSVLSPPPALSSLPASLHIPLPHARRLDGVAVELLCTGGSKAREVLQDGYHAFGAHVLHPSQIFFRSPYSLACVNIKPVLPGHCLVLAARPCPRFTALEAHEVADLWITARRVGAMLEQQHRGTALTLAIQDGPDAGQSVPHVHIHVLPRVPQDLKDNDEIYNMLDESGKGYAVPMDPGVLRCAGTPASTAADSLTSPAQSDARPRQQEILPVELRPLRSLKDMAAEAAVYRQRLAF